MINAVLTFALAIVAAANHKVLKIPTMEIGKDIHGSSVLMPMAGVGTWLYNDTTAEDEVAHAIKLGGRLIATAFVYNNSLGVGRGIRKSGVPRRELFIETMILPGHSTADTIANHEQNLQQLGVETVDLLLSHFPCSFNQSPSGAPLNCTKTARQATWKGLEALYRAGKARAIGVSHYCQQHLEDILEIATVKISANQQEWHVGMGPDPQGLVSFCKKHGISFQSFSPLCGPCPKGGHRELIVGPLVTSIAKAHNVTGAQVSLKWLVQQGSPVIPKSSNPTHIMQDLSLFGFSLTEDEMARLSAAISPPSAEPVSADCALPTTVVV